MCQLYLSKAEIKNKIPKNTKNTKKKKKVKSGFLQRKKKVGKKNRHLAGGIDAWEHGTLHSEPEEYVGGMSSNTTVRSFGGWGCVSTPSPASLQRPEHC